MAAIAQVKSLSFKALVRTSDGAYEYVMEIKSAKQGLKVNFYEVGVKKPFYSGLSHEESFRAEVRKHVPDAFAIIERFEVLLDWIGGNGDGIFTAAEVTEMFANLHTEPEAEEETADEEFDFEGWNDGNADGGDEDVDEDEFIDGDEAEFTDPEAQARAGDDFLDDEDEDPFGLNAALAEFNGATDDESFDDEEDAPRVITPAVQVRRNRRPARTIWNLFGLVR